MKYIWENPEIIKENKEDGHAIAMCYDRADSAAKRAESPYKMSLNGQWKFHWEKGVAELPTKFREPDFDDAEWAAEVAKVGGELDYKK